MTPETVPSPAPKAQIWTGRVLTGLLGLFLLFDSAVKVVNAAPAVEGTIRLGYPVSEVVPIGIALLICTILYLIPRTCVLGAILLTGYLGGATATQVRVQDPWFVFPVVLGILAWAALFLRYPRLRSLVPFRG